MKLLCDSMIPLLALLLVIAAHRNWRRTLPSLLISLGWVFLWQTLDRSFRLWASMGLDYSSHTAVALAVATSLAFRGKQWFAAAATVCVVYAALMRHLEYHTIADMLSTAAVVLPASIAATWFIGRRETARPTPAQD